MRTIILILFFSLSFFINSQEKHEHEESIAAEVAPKASQNFINKFILSKNKTSVKWYKETNEKGVFFEAKLKFQKTLHSIKFDSLGNIDDIEILMPFKQIPDTVRFKISQKFESEFKKFKIIKTQMQLTGSYEDLSQLYSVKNQNAPYYYETEIVKPLSRKYEIEIKVQNNQETESYEFLFNENGHLIQHRKIIVNATDHLNY